MAKIKVHEIAKELEKQSKEVIAFLQDKGIEVKAAQSSLEEDVADMVRKAFGKAAPKAEETTPKAEKPSAPKAEEKVEEKPAKTVENKEAKPVQNAGEQPKKKKKIIFVSNPHNSNIPGQRPQGERKQAQGNRPAGNNRPNQGRPQQEAPHKIIRPLTAPSVPESTQVDFKQNARRMESERIAAKNAQAVQKPVVENVKPASPVREGNASKANPRDERYQKNEKTQGNGGNNQG